MNHVELVMEILRRTGWSQVQAADAIGVTQPTLSRWLNGSDVKGENLAKLHAAARELGIRIQADESNMDAGPGAVATRLRTLRLAYASELFQLGGLNMADWIAAEIAGELIGPDLGNAILDAVGVPPDWVNYGEPAGLSKAALAKLLSASIEHAAHPLATKSSK